VSEKHFQIKSGEQYLTLNVLLKLSGLIQTGGMAKFFSANNVVLVNGEPDNRRGRKLYHGDQVSIGNDLFVID